nr:MAG TPA: large terminase [Caudoviricetes sp.]
MNEPLDPSESFERYYMNSIQTVANIIDPNAVFAELGRGTGKTEGIMTPRILRVANAMPGELAYLVHKTFVALITNVWPNIQVSFSRNVMVNGKVRPIMEYGVDYIVGEGKIPNHFRRPRYPITDPKHSILFRDGFHLKLVSSDQPESVAGGNAVHAFIEEMKHNKGEKLKSRLFPTLRGGSAEIRKCFYYQGITAVSDTARVDLGEDDWFESYEKNANPELEAEIMTVALHLNAALYKKYLIQDQQRNIVNPVELERMRLELQRCERIIKTWTPRLADMRRNCTVYLRASSFCNKDILGPKYFKTQLETLDIDEFLSSICSIRHKAVVNRFFANYDKAKHQYSDGYRYSSILKLDLKDKFILTARYLKHYNPHDELLVGYDPGHFSSMVVAQESDYGRRMRAHKEFWACYPDEQPELARQFYEYFGGDAVNKRIILYPDRAGNKSREELEQITTDSRLMKRELESYGFEVQLMNEGQATVYHWQQFKLLLLIFGGRSNALPEVLVDENECPSLCSAIQLSPLKKTEGKIELDKSSEKKVPLHKQAALTTQLPSAFIYLLWGRYGEKVLSDLSSIPDNLPDNIYV